MEQDPILKATMAAIAADDATTHRQEARRRLSDAYAVWKATNRVRGRIEPDSNLMEEMNTATAAEYEALLAAQKAEANARKRLKTAVRNAREYLVSLQAVPTMKEPVA